LVRTLNQLILFATRHWLALVNASLALVLALSFLAPLLMRQGYTGAGNLLYWLFRPMCHQLPERSFFLGGPQLWYTYAELASHLGGDVPLRYVGDPQLGYKMAMCQRDVAIYAGWLLAGLAFALYRRQSRSIRWRWLVLASLPIGVDGLLQLSGLVESNWQRRVATGLLFGIGLIWVAFPLVEWGMSDAGDIARRSLEESRAGE
jgi:uncharacterized membrane protein